MTKQFVPTEPGVYFGLPMAAYLEIRAVGSSHLRDMEISPLDSWANNYDPDREKQETTATIRGEAFHAAVLEGETALTERFFPKLNREAFPDALWSLDQLKAKCEELGEKKNGTLLAIATRLAEAGVDVQTLGPLIEVEYLAEHEGKQQIPADTWDSILRTRSVMVAANVTKAFTGGEPEVTVVWRDEATGLLCKIRVDYLKRGAAFDLKTFANSHGKCVEKAVSDAFIYNRYHMQGAWIERGLEQFNALPKFLAIDGGSAPASLELDPPLGVTEIENPKLFFFFYQTGGAPNVLGREFASHAPGGIPNAYYEKGHALVEYNLGRLAGFLARFGDKPWISETIVKAFDDSDFPSFQIV